MARFRRPTSVVLLVLMLLGIAAGAGAALASGGCCAGMPAPHGSSDATPPCHSVAPTSCCEPTASAPVTIATLSSSLPT